MIYNPPSEYESALATRVAAPLLALLGLYPQYRAISSIWLGWAGSPHWARHDEVNRRYIYIIEPVVESLLQLFCQSIILYVFIGPGEGMDQGQCKKKKVKKQPCDVRKLRLFYLNFNFFAILLFH